LIAKIFKKYSPECSDNEEEKVKPDFNFIIS
jgi:hypothetical protein